VRRRSGPGASVKIGDTLYKYDREVRVYDKPGIGGRTIEAKKYVEMWVVGETSRSWLVSRFGPGPNRAPTEKIPKNKPLEAPYHQDWNACEEAMWVTAQGHYIGLTVGYLRDAKLLRQIAALINHKDIDRK
jgi:hypothetical protein